MVQAKIKLVLDTSIVISAHLKPQGMERRALDFALSSHSLFFVTSEILAEYSSVLARVKFHFDPNDIAISLGLIRTKATFVSPFRRIHVSPDENDNRFLECADQCDADYLVAENIRRFPPTLNKTLIVKTQEFFDRNPDLQDDSWREVCGTQAV